MKECGMGGGDYSCHYFYPVLGVNNLTTNMYVLQAESWWVRERQGEREAPNHTFSY